MIRPTLCSFKVEQSCTNAYLLDYNHDPSHVIQSVGLQDISHVEQVLI